MSLFQSHLRRAELIERVSGRRSAQQQTVTFVRCATFGWGLFAALSCSFDSAPRTGGNQSAVSEQPDAAVARDASAAAVRDAAADAQDSGDDSAVDAGSVRPSDTTMVMTSPGASPGAMTAPERPRDAGATRDASTPPPPQQNMAGTAAPAPMDMDAGVAARDAGGSNAPAAEPNPHCREGLYAGTFSGSIQLIGLALSSVTGTVRTELMLNTARTYLEIRDARVVGVDQDGNSLTVDLSGNINCASRELEDGTLANGILHNVSSNTDTAFTGAAQAMYSEDPHSVVGTWTVQATDLAALLTGRGTWSLILND